MAKDTYYFRHDYNARNDHKTSALISDHGPAGYGIYWCLIEMLHEEETHKLPRKELFYRAVAKQMSTDVEQVRTIVDACSTLYELFISDADFFYSERVLRNIDNRLSISESRRRAGKASAEKRAKEAEEVQKLVENSTSVEQVLTGVEQIPTKERKGKEIKGNNNTQYIPETGVSGGRVKLSADEYFLKLFNSLTDKSHRKLPEKAKRQLAARIKEGYSSAMFTSAIKNCMADKHHRESNLKYLTPEFITRADIIEKYLTETKTPVTGAIIKPITLSTLEAQADFYGGGINPDFKPSNQELYGT